MTFDTHIITLNIGAFKKNLGLFTKTEKYNLLAQLISDDSHIPIRFVIFNGTNKAFTMCSVREFGNICLLFSIVVSIPFTRVEKNEMTPDKFKMTPDRNKKSPEQILEFCVLPRNILEIAVFWGLKEKKSVRRHIRPLIEQGRLAMTLPDKPNSKNQKYITIK